MRQRIIRAAGPIFAQKGFQGATVREICRKAGVNVAAVNYYFGSKENLYRETVAAAHPVKFMQSPMQPPWSPDASPAEKLRMFIATMLERILQLDPHSWQEELLLREVLNPTPICQSMIRHHFRAGMEMLRSICQELLPPDVPEDVLLRTMLSIVAQCVYYRTARKVLMVVLGAERFCELFSIEHLVEHITGFSLAALGVGPPVREWGHSPPEVSPVRCGSQENGSSGDGPSGEYATAPGAVTLTGSHPAECLQASNLQKTEIKAAKHSRRRTSASPVRSGA